MNRKIKVMLKTKVSLAIMASILSFSSCQKYIDVVPDNVATIDNAFTLRNEAERFLFTCYSYLPKNADPLQNIGFLAGDEVWIPFAQRELLGSNWHIARGAQSRASVLSNIWEGSRRDDGTRDNNMWQAIRDCNIFLENIVDPNKVRDISLDERSRWIGEAKFLKAYYHFLLMRNYGAIPISKENIDISADASQVRVVQRPVEEVVAYIISLLDESLSEAIPTSIMDTQNEMGRLTKPIIAAVKAQVLLTAASPLFNGNTDYANFQNSEGELLFNQTFDEQKWVVAAAAAKEAMEVSEAAGFRLFVFDKELNAQFSLSDSTATVLSINNGFNERWQMEHIWANPNSRAWNIQRDAMPLLTNNPNNVGAARQHLSAPLKIAEMFYTNNGVPINEDKTLNFNNRYTVRTATAADRFYIKEGYETARLNFDREPRFYASLGFDGGIWFKYDTESKTDEETFVVEAKMNQNAGAINYGWANETGYFLKKMVNWQQSFSESSVSYREYPWPEIRLSDVYLMFAEATNEATGPSAEVYAALDKIRERAGLEGVIDSWSKYSSNPAKPTTKEGLREIIRQERLIELAFEGKRFWDLRRWKTAVNHLNQNITGWSISQPISADYYRIRPIFSQTFVAPRDYFWPISEAELTVNPSLVQNIGW